MFYYFSSPQGLDLIRVLNTYTPRAVRSLQVGQTALHLAVRHGRASTVKLLLAHGANVNAQDQAGTTALISACDRGHADIVRILLQDPDCDVNLTDKVRSSFKDQKVASVTIKQSVNNFRDLILM